MNTLALMKSKQGHHMVSYKYDISILGGRRCVYQCCNFAKVRVLKKGYPKMLRRRIITGSKSLAKTKLKFDLQQRMSQFKYGYFITKIRKFKLKVQITISIPQSSSFIFSIPLVPFSVSSWSPSSSGSYSSSPRATASSTIFPLRMEIQKI